MKKLVYCRVVAMLMTLCAMLPTVAPAFAALSEADRQNFMQEYFQYNTEFQDIKQSSNGEYALEMDSQFAHVERRDIDLSNITEVNNLVSDVDIPVEVRNVIWEHFEKAKNNPSLFSDSTITLFSPAIMTRSTEWTPEYTYTDPNGGKHQMKSYRIYSNGISTEMETVESGANTMNTNIISNGTTVALTAIGAVVANPAVSLAVTLGGGALTLYEAYLFYTDAQVTSGSRYDYVQAAITYDSIHQFTYVKNGETWRFGLQTTWADITDIDFRVYFYNARTHSGQLFEDEFQSEYGVRCEEIYTRNFNSPYARTYNLFLQGTQDIESISIKIGSKKFEIG